MDSCDAIRGDGSRYRGVGDGGRRVSRWRARCSRIGAARSARSSICSCLCEARSSGSAAATRSVICSISCSSTRRAEAIACTTRRHCSESAPLGARSTSGRGGNTRACSDRSARRLRPPRAGAWTNCEAHDAIGRRRSTVGQGHAAGPRRRGSIRSPRRRESAGVSRVDDCLSHRRGVRALARSRDAIRCGALRSAGYADHLRARAGGCGNRGWLPVDAAAIGARGGDDRAARVASGRRPPADGRHGIRVDSPLLRHRAGAIRRGHHVLRSARRRGHRRRCSVRTRASVFLESPGR